MRGLRSAVAAVVVLSCFGCRPGSARGAWDFSRMREQRRYDPFGASGVFPGGSVEQAAPEGAVAVDDSMPATAGATDSVVMARGAHQYAISCAPCHGAAGFGGGLVGANIVGPHPGSLRDAKTAALAPAVLYDVVSNGRGAMAGMAWQMTPTQRWSVVAYVRALQAVAAGRGAALGAASAWAPGAAVARDDSTRAARMTRLDSLRSARPDLDAAGLVRAGLRDST